MKRYLTQLIAKGKTSKVIKKLLSVSQQLEKELQEEIVVLAARLERFEKSQRLDTSSLDEQNISLNKINRDILVIIEKLPNDLILNIVPKGSLPPVKGNRKRLWQIIGSIGLIIGILVSIPKFSDYIQEEKEADKEQKNNKKPIIGKKHANTKYKSIENPFSAKKEVMTTVEKTNDYEVLKGRVYSAINPSNQQQVHLEMKIGDEIEKGVNKVIGTCRINDLNNPNHWIKLSVVGRYDEETKRLYINSGSRISGSNMEYCNFYINGFYRWGNTSFNGVFRANTNINSILDCRKFTKISVAKT